MSASTIKASALLRARGEPAVQSEAMSKETLAVERRDNLDESVRAALRQLIERGLTADIDLSEVVPDEVQNSWRRSISSQVNPAGLPPVKDMEEQEELLRRTVNRVMDRWHGTLSNTRTTLLFGNASGQIIQRRSLDAREGRLLDRAGAVEGSDFSESGTGTNALGTSIESRNPILIQGAQHFLESLSGIACAAAPVIHPLTGRVVGSVSISAPASEANEYMVAITRQASQEIAEGLLEGANSRDIEMVKAFRKARQGKRGVLVMNQDSIMADLPSLPHIDTEVHAALWDQFQGRLQVGEERSFEIEDIGVAGTVANVGVRSEPILQLRLRNLAGVRAPETQRALPVRDAASSYAEPPPEADDAVSQWWREMNTVAQQTDNELIVHIPTGSDGASWVNRWSSMSGHDRITTERSRSSHEHAVTEGPAFPGLSQRRTSLADLARGVYQGPAEPPRFTAEAFSAMLAWPWPGDMQELSDLINSLHAPTSGNWTVELSDLPAHLATSPSRNLSRWEQTERDSILSALFDTHGNKSDAAAILGIGRTTLYRKLRTLSITEAQIAMLLSYHDVPDRSFRLD